MNITQSSSTGSVNPNLHEVSLRTLSSDISSLERGSQTPVPEHVTTTSADPIQADMVKVSKKEISIFRLFLALIFLAAIGVGMYIYVYPILTGGKR